MIVGEIQNLCFIISGLVLANSYERAQKTFGSKLEHNELVYRKIFELGRRAKVINPNQMRATYGKMMWMLMDSSKDDIERRVGFSCVEPDIRTVYNFIINKHRDDAEAFLK